MAYTKLNTTVPDGITQTGPQITPSIRANQSALGDAIIIGSMVDWDMAVTQGSLEQPEIIVYQSLVDSNQRLRLTFTWNVDGDPEVVVYDKMVDGAVYDRVGTKSIAWSASGSVISISWT